MSHAGVAATRGLVQDTLALVRDLDDQEWARASACAGWRVQDCVTHMGVFFNIIADPGMEVPPNPSGLAERANDLAVQERAHWTPSEAIAYYTAQSTAGLAALESLQLDQFRDNTVELTELGVYKVAQMSDAMAFDHLVHLTCDLLAPYGPVEGAPVVVDVEAAIAPAIDWMIAGLPKMCGQALHPNLAVPVGLLLTGETRRAFVLDRDPDAPGAVRVRESADLPRDVVTSSAFDFLRWGTTRAPWRSAVTVSGDGDRAASVLDAINIV